MPLYRAGDRVRSIRRPIRASGRGFPTYYVGSLEHYAQPGTIRGVLVRRSITESQDVTTIMYAVVFDHSGSEIHVDEPFVLPLDQDLKRHREEVLHCLRLVEEGVSCWITRPADADQFLKEGGDG